MSLVSRACYRAITAAAELPVNHRLDRLLANSAIAAIAVYQVSLSHWTRTTCIFHPSCSRRTQTSLRELGFKMGLRNAVMQLARCDGAYDLSAAVNEQVLLRSADGLVFSESEIAPQLRTTLPKRDIWSCTEL